MTIERIRVFHRGFAVGISQTFIYSSKYFFLQYNITEKWAVV